MMDENTAEGQGPEDGTGTVPTTDVDSVGQTDGLGSDESQDTAALLRDKKLARENASLRKRLRELEASNKAREEAELSEQEKANRRVIEMQEALEATRAQMRNARLTAAISSESARFGIVDVDAATRLLDTTDLDYDDEAGWTGIGDALQALTVERPWLIQTGTPGVDANPANPARRRSRLTRDDLARMSEAEVAALSDDEIHAALAER